MNEKKTYKFLIHDKVIDNIQVFRRHSESKNVHMATKITMYNGFHSPEPSFNAYIVYFLLWSILAHLVYEHNKIKRPCQSNIYPQ